MNSHAWSTRLGAAVVVLVAAVVVAFVELVAAHGGSRGAALQRARAVHSATGDLGPAVVRPVGILNAFGPE